MKLPKIIFVNQEIFQKIPLWLVLLVAAVIGFNIFLNIKIDENRQKLFQLEKAAIKPPRIVPAEFAKKTELGGKSCPWAKAGNPNAPLKFKIFETETCPFCVAQNEVMEDLLPEYGDLMYAEWYNVTECIKESSNYRVSGVPTFVFEARGVEKPPAYGFLDKQQLTDYICRVSEQC